MAEKMGLRARPTERELVLAINAAIQLDKSNTFDALLSEFKDTKDLAEEILWKPSRLMKKYPKETEIFLDLVRQINRGKSQSSASESVTDTRTFFARKALPKTPQAISQDGLEAISGVIDVKNTRSINLILDKLLEMYKKEEFPVYKGLKTGPRAHLYFPKSKILEVCGELGIKAKE